MLMTMNLVTNNIEKKIIINNLNLKIMTRVLFFAIAASIVLSSCSKNDVSEVANPNDNPNSIGLTVGTYTTKAETNTTGMNATDNVVNIYYYGAGDNDGSLSFTYSGSTWSEANSTTWSNFDDLFPVTFFSLNSGTTPSGDIEYKSITDESAITSTYQVKGDVSSDNDNRDITEQEDLVYYGAKLAAIPTGNNITAVFKHALSRIKMQYLTTDDMLLYIAKVRICNIDGSAIATVTVTDESVSSITWGSNSGYESTYNYFADATASTDTATDPKLAGKLNATTTATDFADAEDDRFIIPQTASFTSVDFNSSYIEVIYCSTSKAGTPIIGYTSADLHPHFSEFTDKGILANTPLYAKVAFPLTDFTFSAASYYNLILNFDGNNILGAADDFVDKDGNEYDTDDFEDSHLPGKDEDVNPESTNKIGLTVAVLQWSEDSDSEVGNDQSND